MQQPDVSALVKCLVVALSVFYTPVLTQTSRCVEKPCARRNSMASSKKFIFGFLNIVQKTSDLSFLHS